MDIAVHPDILLTIPDIRLGVVQSQVHVLPSSEDLLYEMGNATERIISEMSIEDIALHPVNSQSRKAYKALGKDPSRYRPSAEALLRRILNGKGLYHINNIVDIINLVSVESGFSIGGYDIDKIQGQPELRKGGNEDYKGIGRGLLNISNMPVLYDSEGPFGCPTSDSMRTMITENSINFGMVFFDFGSSNLLMNAMHRAKELLSRYSKANNFELKSIS